MQTQELQIFIDSSIKYFEKITDAKAELGTPRLRDENDMLLDYSGVIGITGGLTGAIGLSAPQAMIEELMNYTNPNDDKSQENMKDITGELANIIAGQAQKSFSSEFDISIPVILTNKGSGARMEMSEPTFIVPAKWKAHTFYLVIGLRKE